MKKIIAAVVILGFALTACGQPVSSQVSSTASSVESQPMVESKLADYDLSVYGNLPSNINHGGRAVLNGDTIIYMDTESTEKICAYDIASREHSAFLDEGGMYLNVSNGNLYFVGIKAGGLKRVSVSGGTPEVILDITPEMFFVYASKLYYSTPDGIFTADADGKNSVSIYPGAVQGMCMYEGDLFVINSDGRVGKLNSDGTLALIGDVNASDMVVNNGWLYYIDVSGGRCVAKIRLDGTDKSVLTPYMSDEISIYGDGYVYYINRESGRHVTRMTCNGEDVAPACRDTSYSITVVSDYVIYIGTDTNQLRIVEIGKKAPEDFMYF